MRKEIVEKLKELIYDYLGKRDIDISEESLLIEDLGFSSLDLISISGNIEDCFDIEIEDKAIYEIRSVGDAAEFIERKLSE
ncbi:MAG: acyl carrier protein [Anaerolineaceae bacterium]|nr:acyl carrier protein [Anaerolineaceae bacterium]MBQ6492448.1 acyl carrier protein [Erysipelotrichaceae bacterium]